MELKPAKLSYFNSNDTKFRLQPCTIRSQIEYMCNLEPSKDVYVFSEVNKAMGFGEINTKALTTAQRLFNLGLRKGDVIAMALPNTPDALCFFFGAAYAGLVVVLMNPSYKVSEFEKILGTTKARCLCISDRLGTTNWYKMIRKMGIDLEESRKGDVILPKLPSLKQIIMAKSDVSSECEADQLIKDISYDLAKDILCGKPMEMLHELPEVCTDDPLLIYLSSGTTGTPKCIVHSHFSVLNHSHLMAMTPGKHSWLENTLSPFGLDHTTHMSLAVLSPLFTGNRGLIPSSTDVNFSANTKGIMREIEANRCECLLANPTILRDMIRELASSSSNLYSLRCLKYIYCAGRIAGRELIEQVMRMLDLEFFCNSYGTSETLNISMSFIRKTSSARESETVGRPRPLIECKIINAKTGLIVPVNTDGELCVRSFCLMKHYLGDSRKTDEAIDANRWYRTGDIMSIDEDGNLYYKDRMNDLIIIGDEKVYPSEIENQIQKLNAVSECCVVGLDSKQRNSEDIYAFVRLKPIDHLDRSKVIKDINHWCSETMADYKVPKAILIVDEFPRNRNGKVIKSRLVKLIE